MQIDLDYPSSCRWIASPAMHSPGNLRVFLHHNEQEEIPVWSRTENYCCASWAAENKLVRDPSALQWEAKLWIKLNFCSHRGEPTWDCKGWGTCAARNQLSAAMVGTLYNMAIIMAGSPLPFSIDLNICLSFKSRLHSKAYEHYDRRAKRLWSKKMNSAWKGTEKNVEEQSSVCSASWKRWDTIFAHTCSMKANIRKKKGAAWPSEQHCHENNGQRLVVNKLMLENRSVLFIWGEDRKIVPRGNSATLWKRLPDLWEMERNALFSQFS